MKKIFLCGHTGSYNRGCDAIVRSTKKVFKDYDIDQFYLASFFPLQDKESGIDNETEIISYNKHNSKASRLNSGIRSKLLLNYEKAHKCIQKPLWERLDKNSLCLNIGGDTYCYSRPITSYALTSHNKKRDIPTVLWCCSIEEKLVDNEMFKDFKRYSLIIPREIITYRTLLKLGIPKEKMFLSCDPAFNLDVKETKLPIEMENKKIIGINLSHMVIKDSASNNKVFCNIQILINYILKETDYNICMIPHVYNYQDQDQDIKVLKTVKELYKKEKRVSLINNSLNSMELKYIISKCDYFIGARTHSTIAAYSLNIPTLALGYSIKSKGIAEDIFGTYDGYVLPYDEVLDNFQLKEAFIGIMNDREKILQRYADFMPIYKERVFKAAHFVLDKVGHVDI